MAIRRRVDKEVQTLSDGWDRWVMLGHLCVAEKVLYVTYRGRDSKTHEVMYREENGIEVDCM